MMNNRRLLTASMIVAGSVRMAFEGHQKETPKVVAYTEEVVRVVETMTVVELKFLVRGLERRLFGQELNNQSYRKPYGRPPKVLGRSDLAKISRNPIRR